MTKETYQKYLYALHNKTNDATPTTIWIEKECARAREIT